MPFSAEGFYTEGSGQVTCYKSNFAIGQNMPPHCSNMQYGDELQHPLDMLGIPLNKSQAHLLCPSAQPLFPPSKTLPALDHLPLMEWKHFIHFQSRHA